MAERRKRRRGRRGDKIAGMDKVLFRAAQGDELATNKVMDALTVRLRDQLRKNPFDTRLHPDYRKAIHEAAIQIVLSNIRTLKATWGRWDDLLSLARSLIKGAAQQARADFRPGDTGRDEEGSDLESEGEISPPLFAVVWDPAVVTDDEYAELVGAFGDLVRAHGGAGVRRLQELDVAVEAGVLQP